MNTAIVIGGGVIGLSIAWQLLREGYPVLVFEKDSIDRTTSSISGGMLCPYSETRFDDDWVLLHGLKSLALYPGFLENLQEDSGQGVEMEGNGTLLIASNRDEYQILQHIYHKMMQRVDEFKWLSSQEIREKEPLLTDHVVGGVCISRESQLNSRKLLQSLEKAISQKGGVIYENVRVKQIWEEGGKALGVVINHGERVKGAFTIIAAGAWSKSLKMHVNLYPIKGQIITALIPDTIQISHVIRTPQIYLIPKKDQTMKIGATMEDVGFNREVTIGGVQCLLQEAWRVMPVVAEFVFLSVEAGLRSMTPQRIPVIRKERIKSLYTATGHGRDAVLLAPYTAYFIIDLIKKNEKEIY